MADDAEGAAVAVVLGALSDAAVAAWASPKPPIHANRSRRIMVALSGSCVMAIGRVTGKILTV